jgi:hypothetical protein
MSRYKTHSVNFCVVSFSAQNQGQGNGGRNFFRPASCLQRRENKVPPLQASRAPKGKTRRSLLGRRRRPRTGTPPLSEIHHNLTSFDRFFSCAVPLYNGHPNSGWRLYNVRPQTRFNLLSFSSVATCQKRTDCRLLVLPTNFIAVFLP